MDRLLTPLLLATLALAGCAGPGETNPYHSFEEALAADGMVLHGTTADSHFVLRLLAPYPDAAVGDNRVILLLYDNATKEPVTDATIQLDATMPAMGHGTPNEADPQHEGFGVYIGHTDLFMAGSWQMAFDVYGVPGLDDVYVVPVMAGGGMDGMTGMDGSDSMDGNETGMGGMQGDGSG